MQIIPGDDFFRILIFILQIACMLVLPTKQSKAFLESSEKLAFNKKQEMQCIFVQRNRRTFVSSSMH
jgi:hypothetical protein